jgi:hypothetical protein
MSVVEHLPSILRPRAQSAEQQKTFNNILYRNRQKSNTKIPTEAQESQNRQYNSEQKEKFWRYHNAQIQTALQSHSNKNSMALAQKQICRQWNQVKDQEIRSHCYSHVIFHNVFKNIMLDERHPLLEMVQGNRIST